MTDSAHDRTVEILIDEARDTGRWHHALDVASALLATATATGDPAAQARARTRLAGVLFETGRHDDALYHLLGADKTFPHDADVAPDHRITLLLLADVHRARGNPHAAAIAANRAWKLPTDRDEDNDQDHAGNQDIRRLAGGTGSAAPARHTTSRRAAPRHRLDPSVADTRWSDDTAWALADAHGALASLDRTARHSAFGAALARSSRLRDVRARAHLTGLHLSLQEVLIRALPDPVPGPRPHPELIRHLDADTLAHDDPPAGDVPDDSTRLGLITRIFAQNPDDDQGPRETVGHPAAPGSHGTVAGLLRWAADHDTGPPRVAKAALVHLHLMTTHPLRSGHAEAATCHLATAWTRLGLLSKPWLPLSEWIGRHHRQYLRHLAQADASGDAEPFVAFLAAGVADACRNELALIDRLDAVYHQVRPALGAGRTRDAAAAALVAFPVVNRRRHPEHHGPSDEIIDTLLAAGLVIPLMPAVRKQVFGCSAALHVLTGGAQTSPRPSTRPLPPTTWHVMPDERTTDEAPIATTALPDPAGAHQSRRSSPPNGPVVTRPARKATLTPPPGIGTASRRRTRPAPALWPAATISAVAGQYEAGASLRHLAAVTGATESALSQAVADVGAPAAGTPRQQDPERSLWALDPVILAAAAREHRRFLAVGEAARAQPRRGGPPSLGERLAELVRHQAHRLLDHVGGLDPADRAGGLLRLVIAAPVDLDGSAARALTDSASSAADECAPELAATLLAWLGHLHAAAGRVDDALRHSAAERELVATFTGRPGTDPHAGMDARWRRAALLTHATGSGEAELLLHAEQDRHLTGQAPALDAAAPDTARHRLLLARNHAAWGCRLLTWRTPGGTDHPVDHLDHAVTLFDHVIDDHAAHAVDPLQVGYERTLAAVASGFAHHPLSPRKATTLWTAAARWFSRVQLPHHHQRERAAHVRAVLDMALDDAVSGWEPPGATTPVPRIPPVLVHPDLLVGDVLGAATSAPLPTLPDLPALH